MLPDELKTMPFYSLVEIGCGNGDLLVRLAVRQPQASFIGIEPDMALAGATARRIDRLALNHRVSIQQADIFDTGVETGWADVVLYRLSYQQLLTTEAALREAARLLKPGGCLYTHDGACLSKIDLIELHEHLLHAGRLAESYPLAVAC